MVPEIKSRVNLNYTSSDRLAREEKGIFVRYVKCKFYPMGRFCTPFVHKTRFRRKPGICWLGLPGSGLGNAPHPGSGGGLAGPPPVNYRYSKNYSLLGAALPDGRKVAYDHNVDGGRTDKRVNGKLEEEYEWLDLQRLAQFRDTVNDWLFLYGEGGRVPHAATVNDTKYTLHYDQVGSLRAIVSPTGNVVKSIQYDPFGNILWDSNPALRVPIGFAGGLFDPNTGFVRFGWRDYDLDTGRWTAPDPIGERGGDEDWYGYCLDDPVNLVDSTGLAAFLPLFLAGQALGTAIGGGGSLLAGLMADGTGAVAGKNQDDPLKATKGAAKGATGAAAINTGIAATATGAAGLAKAAPAAAAAAPSLIRQGKDAVKAVAGKGQSMAKAGTDWIKTNPYKVDKATRVVNDVFNESMPPETNEGQVIIAGKKLAEELYESAVGDKCQNNATENKNRQAHTGWRGR